MAKLNRPRHGSLQFYPRKRIDKFLPSVNWETIKTDKEGILGLIAYKVGMATAIVKDNTPNSLTKGRKIALPVTILEVPNIKVYSARFYKNGRVMTEVVVSHDKELRRKVKLGKTPKKLENMENYDDVRVIIYSSPKDTSLKKTPDIAEVAIHSADKLAFVKSLIGKELTLKDVLKWNLLDVRGLTKGKGLVGPVKRFGLELKQHKSEKGVRKPGSLGPWHPAHVTFRTPISGQMGMFTRLSYNVKVIDSGDIKEKDINKKEGFKNYGNIKTSYLVLLGSVQGPQKRQILLTPAFRATKKQSKKVYELVELVK